MVAGSHARWVSVGSSPPHASTSRRDLDGNARQRSSRSPRSLVWPSTRRPEIHSSLLLWLTTRGCEPSAPPLTAGSLLWADALRELLCLLLALASSSDSPLLRLLPMPQLCLAVASLALSTSRPVSVVLLANRLSLVLPYLLCYHTLLSSAVVSRRVKPSCNSASLLIIFSLVSASGCTCGHETGGISLNLLFRWFRRAVTPDHSSTG